MRKQNSTVKTSFISEPGSTLINGDYFAYVELDEYACYVIADGIGDRLQKESSRLAVESIIMKFQEKPSISSWAVDKYLKYANNMLLKENSYEKLKASVMVVVTNYEKMRYGYVGNVRLRSYREGFVQNATVDMSLSEDLYEEEKISKDALARHEERDRSISNRLYQKNINCRIRILSPYIPGESGKIWMNWSWMIYLRRLRMSRNKR